MTSIGKLQSTGAAPPTSGTPTDPGQFELPEDMTSAGSGDMMSYLKVMQEMQEENRKFTLLSQIITMRHEAAKNAAQNIR